LAKTDKKDMMVFLSLIFSHMKDTQGSIVGWTLIWGMFFFYSFYGKANQMHNISNLFYFGTTLYIQ
jgi:hypothetical protein